MCMLLAQGNLSAPLASLQMIPSWVVRSTHWKDMIPSRGTWTSSRSGPLWTTWGSTRPSARSCTWVGATPAVNWEQSGREVLGGTGGWKAEHELTEGKPYHGLHPQQCGQQVEGENSAPLLCSGETPPGLLRTALEPSDLFWTCWSRSRGGPQKWSEGWNTSPVGKGWESWGCSAWRGEGSRDTL